MDVFRIGTFEVRNRLFVGTGKYASYELMQQALDARGCQVVTVAVRRERLVDKQGRSLLDYLDLDRYVILPNTAGCFSAEDAIRVSLLGRDLLEKNGNKGAGWVKLEVLGDKKTLYPDMVETLRATEVLIREGFQVMVYCTDDPLMAKRLEEMGAAAIMPLAAPIGSGLGIQNPVNIRLIVEEAKVPVIVDAGVGTASDAAIAMELGCDGVLMNTAIAEAKNPIMMARAMKLAVEAGRLAYLAGRMPKRRYADPSSPLAGLI